MDYVHKRTISGALSVRVLVVSTILAEHRTRNTTLPHHLGSQFLMIERSLAQTEAFRTPGKTSRLTERSSCRTNHHELLSTSKDGIVESKKGRDSIDQKSHQTSFTLTLACIFVCLRWLTFPIHRRVNTKSLASNTFLSLEPAIMSDAEIEVGSVSSATDEESSSSDQEATKKQQRKAKNKELREKKKAERKAILQGLKTKEERQAQKAAWKAEREAKKEAKKAKREERRKKRKESKKAGK